MLIYVSGPYSGNTEQNILNARNVAIKVWESGHYAITPHLNTAGFENNCKCQYETYLQGDLDILSRCDIILMIHGWENSKGAKIEKEYAEQQGIPVYYFPDIPPEHPTSKICPEQVKTFKEIVMQMYRLHLEKNADYSPANILGTGEIGLITRLWDKTARLLNLYGFRIQISKSEYNKPSNPKYESIEDTFKDLSIYAIIGLLLKKGVWGK